MEVDGKPNEPGYILGGVLIALLLGLMVAASLAGAGPGAWRRGPGAVLTGAYLQCWGLMFLAAYYFSHKTFFLRGLIWVCEHFSRPAGRGMAFFYFALAFGLGSVAVANGLGLGRPWWSLGVFLDTGGRRTKRSSWGRLSAAAMVT
jgi:hypothetical protein